MSKPKMSLIDSMSKTANTFEKAAGRTDTMLGVPQVDPGYATYTKLKKEDFDDLAREFGLDAVGKYVRSMEAQRMRRK
jgi:hypothetical protein